MITRTTATIRLLWISILPFTVLAYVLPAALDPSQEVLQTRLNGPLSAWLTFQTPISLQGILDNVGSSGSKARDASPGVIVASPSRNNPDYFFTWTRDAGLVTKCLVDQFLTGGPPSLEGTIQDYINAQTVLQSIDNLSGGLCSGGLAEPKHEADLTAFTGNWGRPQRDGPAIRATAMIAYANYLISQGRIGNATEIIWPMVSNDLSYVSENWNRSGFDLWEEVNSSSFFTTAVQYRALVEGSAFAAKIGKTCPHCDSQAPQVLCFLQSYWTGKYALSNTGGGRSGRDANSLLTSIHLFDPAAGCDSNTFQPCSDRALANHKVVTDAFRSLYPVNHGIPRGKGVAVGRYPEDVYQGGHPWYLSTFAAAEQLYDAIFQWKQQGSITITETSLPFFQDVYSSAAVGTYASSSSATFTTILHAVAEYADSYMSNAQQYTPQNGALAEQYSRSTGIPLSATDLTWSYAAFLTANNARKAMMPAPWGAAAANLPSTCPRTGNGGGGGSAAIPTGGPCAPATATFPRPTPPIPTCTTPPPPLTKIHFQALVPTTWGERVFLVGNLPQLGNWNVEEAVLLSAESYSSDRPIWNGTVEVEVGVGFEYKYLRKVESGGEGERVWWEGGENRRFVTPVGDCEGEVRRVDGWR